jgi:hypothetical protein
MYSNWGLFGLEPNAYGNETCVIAKHSEAFYPAWGWADYSCFTRMPYICRLAGGPCCCQGCPCQTMSWQGVAVAVVAVAVGVWGSMATARISREPKASNRCCCCRCRAGGV